MREVVRGDKHNLRKSANCNAQISPMCGVNDTDLCVAICRFSQVVFCHLEQLHAQSPFLFPIVFSIDDSLILISFLKFISETGNLDGLLLHKECGKTPIFPYCLTH